MDEAQNLRIHGGRNGNHFLVNVPFCHYNIAYLLQLEETETGGESKLSVGGAATPAGPKEDPFLAIITEGKRETKRGVEMGIWRYRLFKKPSQKPFRHCF